MKPGAADVSPFGVVRELLDELAFTVAVRDLDAHVRCMSRRLRVFGVPGVEALDYAGWFQRRSNELQKPLLYSLAYRDLAIHDADTQEITCSVREVMKGMQGTVMMLDKDMTIVREQDGRWRVLSERIKGASFKN